MRRKGRMDKDTSGPLVYYGDDMDLSKVRLPDNIDLLLKEMDRDSSKKVRRKESIQVHRNLRKRNKFNKKLTSRRKWTIPTKRMA